MSTFFLATISFISLLIISGGISYTAGKIKIPATMALVGAGMLIAFASKFKLIGFLDFFELTPEILFYVFLPILLFESAYNVSYKELLRSLRAITLLAVISLLISAFFIGIALKYMLLLFGVDIPFEVTLLFGALISSTDTAAVLAVFKKLGVPKRLHLIFEGESLFNDGTAIALFLVVLGIVESHAISGVPTTGHPSFFESLFASIEPYLGNTHVFIEGLCSFGSMVGVGILIGAIVGIVFSKIIGKIRNEKNLEITLSLALAHSAFLIAEAINHYFLPVSGIVATVAAAMVLGNYGRYKISPKVEEVMEKYWSFFAFITNNLVFLLVGMMFVNLHADWKPLILPIFIAIPLVVLGRAISVYPIFSILNFSRTEEKVPKSWQHVLSWGALRGGLAVVMVLLIPSTIVLPSWNISSVSVHDFLLSLTLGCVIFSIFVKTITITPLIRYFKIDAMDDVEEFGYIEGKMLMAGAALGKILKIHKEGYLDKEQVEYLTRKYEKFLNSAKQDAERFTKQQGKNFGDLVRRVSALHALGIEKYWLKHLYKYDEIPEPVFKKIMKRLNTQIGRVEKGESQMKKVRNKAIRVDFFERISEYFVDRLEPKIDPLQEKYLELRTLHVIIEKALEGLLELRSIEFIGGNPEFDEVVRLYEGFYSEAERERKTLYKKHQKELRKLSTKLTEKSLMEVEGRILADLSAKEIISQKLVSRFEAKLDKRLYSDWSSY